MRKCLNKWRTSGCSNSPPCYAQVTPFYPSINQSLTSKSNSSNGTSITTMEGIGMVHSFSIDHTIPFTRTFGDAKTYSQTVAATINFQSPVGVRTSYSTATSSEPLAPRRGWKKRSSPCIYIFIFCMPIGNLQSVSPELCVRLLHNTANSKRHRKVE